jgi:hypothetical protein
VAVRVVVVVDVCVGGGRWAEGIWRVWSQVEERRHTSEGGFRTRRMEAVRR